MGAERGGPSGPWWRPPRWYAEIFKQFSSSHRIYRHPTDNKVAIVWENADLQKLESVLSHPNTEKAKAKHTVREPIDIYVEVEGGR